MRCASAVWQLLFDMIRHRFGQISGRTQGALALGGLFAELMAQMGVLEFDFTGCGIAETLCRSLVGFQLGHIRETPLG